uniref:Stress-response A/B barrel domain-containing protein n=1 Tax=Oryza barthii TaxID=65489 RepID=A0A0D3GTE5_9ORYZ
MTPALLYPYTNKLPASYYRSMSPKISRENVTESHISHLHHLTSSTSAGRGLRNIISFLIIFSSPSLITMICLRAAFPLTSSFSSSPLRRLALKPSSSRAAVLRVAAMSSAIAAPVEHIVLIKVRPEAAASGAAAAMVSSLQALSSVVPGLSYIHVGPVLRLRSPAAEALGPTHVLHSRYATKPDLAAYAAHPAHVAAVQGHVLPNALDTTAVDWVRPEAAASGAAAAMVSSLQALSSVVPGLSYIHVGPVLRLRSPAAEALGPTHVLHSRYATKPDLAAYAAHPAHVAAVQGHVLPNALDTTAVDWVNAALVPSPVNPGSAVRLSLAKLKEGVEAHQLAEKLAAATAAAGEAKGAKVSFGENFSPARAKGYQFGMVAVFDSVEGLDAVDGDGKVEAAKAIVRPLLDDVLELEFVVGPAAAEAPAPANL